MAKDAKSVKEQADSAREAELKRRADLKKAQKEAEKYVLTTPIVKAG